MSIVITIEAGRVQIVVPHDTALTLNDPDQYQTESRLDPEVASSGSSGWWLDTPQQQTRDMPEPESESEAEAEPESEAEPEPEADSEPEPEADSEPEAEAEATLPRDWLQIFPGSGLGRFLYDLAERSGAEGFTHSTVVAELRNSGYSGARSPSSVRNYLSACERNGLLRAYPDEGKLGNPKIYTLPELNGR